MSSALVDFIEIQIKSAETLISENKKLAICDDDNTINYHNGVALGLRIGVDDMKSILRVVNDFERLGLFK